MNFTKIDPESISENVIKLINRDWALITAGTEGDYNTMTASWGGMGELWNEPVAFIFVRPQRHTFGFTEKNDKFTLTFFDEKYRKALAFCGSHSGRDYDKAKETGLTPAYGDGYTYFEEAKLYLVCEKLYAQDLKEECFVVPEVSGKNYPTKDFHRMYVGKIVECYVK